MGRAGGNRPGARLQAQLGCGPSPARGPLWGDISLCLLAQTPPSPQLQQQLRGGTARCQGRCFPPPRTQIQVRGRQDQMGWAWYPSVPSQDLGATRPSQPRQGLRQSPKANVLFLWLVCRLNTLSNCYGYTSSCLIFLYGALHRPLSSQAGRTLGPLGEHSRDRS